MAAAATEMMESRQTSLGSQCRHVRKYLITGATESTGPTVHAEQDAQEAVITAAPINFTIVVDGITWTYIRDTIDVEPVLNADPPNSMWIGTCNYVLQIFSKQPYQTGQSSRSFVIGTTQIRSLQALAEVNKYAVTGTAPTAGGLLGLESDGSVSGIDLDIATSKFSETWYVADSSVDSAFIAAVTTLIDQTPVNNATFRDYDAGEVRIIGVTGSKRTSVADWELTFDFAVSYNSTDAAPASGISGIVKKGWESIQFIFAPNTVTVSSNKYTIPKVKFAYVNEVYALGDFSVLGIGS